MDGDFTGMLTFKNSACTFWLPSRVGFSLIYRSNHHVLKNNLWHLWYCHHMTTAKHKSNTLSRPNDNIAIHTKYHRQHGSSSKRVCPICVKPKGKLVPPASWLAENVSACTEETAELDWLVFHLICNCSSPSWQAGKDTWMWDRQGLWKHPTVGSKDHTKPKTIKRNRSLILLEELWKNGVAFHHNKRKWSHCGHMHKHTHLFKAEPSPSLWAYVRKRVSHATTPTCISACPVAMDTTVCILVVHCYIKD